MGIIVSLFAQPFYKVFNLPCCLLSFQNQHANQYIKIEVAENVNVLCYTCSDVFRPLEEVPQ